MAELRHEGTGKSPYKTAPKKNDNQIFPNLYEIFLFLNITPAISVRTAVAGCRGRAAGKGGISERSDGFGSPAKICV